MRLRIALLLLAVLCLPVWAQGQGTSPGPSIPSIIAQYVELTAIGPDGTFYTARARTRPRVDPTASSILPQLTTVRAIGVHDPRDPRWQTTIDGTPAALEVGERNVYVVTVALPTATMGGPNAGGHMPIPVIGASRLFLLNPATGAVGRVVDLAGAGVRSLDVKKVQNAEYVYVVTTSPVTILIFPPPPPSSILEIFDADGNRIKRVTLGAD